MNTPAYGSLTLLRPVLERGGPGVSYGDRRMARLTETNARHASAYVLDFLMAIGIPAGITRRRGDDSGLTRAFAAGDGGSA